MKITKEEAKKILESIKTLEGMYDGGICPDCGAPLDDEGWHNRECPARGGGKRRRYASRYTRPAPTPSNPDEAWKKYLPSFRSKEWNRGKTDDQLKPAILAWLAKQNQAKQVFESIKTLEGMYGRASRGRSYFGSDDYDAPPEKASEEQINQIIDLVNKLGLKDDEIADFISMFSEVGSTAYYINSKQDLIDRLNAEQANEIISTVKNNPQKVKRILDRHGLWKQGRDTFKTKKLPLWIKIASAFSYQGWGHQHAIHQLQTGGFDALITFAKKELENSKIPWKDDTKDYADTPSQAYKAERDENERREVMVKQLEPLLQEYEANSEQAKSEFEQNIKEHGDVSKAWSNIINDYNSAHRASQKPMGLYEQEVKKELLETAGKLLQEAKKKLNKNK
jgi:hypothetical protein